MQMQMSHEEVIEACVEWLEKHYGVLPTNGTSCNYDFYGTMATGQPAIYRLGRVNVNFVDVPRPEGGPYRSPGKL